MAKIQDIVPVNIKLDYGKQERVDQASLAKPKLAVRLKRNGLDVAVYNGCNLYILESVIKAMNCYDS